MASQDIEVEVTYACDEPQPQPRGKRTGILRQLNVWLPHKVLRLVDLCVELLGYWHKTWFMREAIEWFFRLDEDQRARIIERSKRRIKSRGIITSIYIEPQHYNELMKLKPLLEKQGSSLSRLVTTILREYARYKLQDAMSRSPILAWAIKDALKRTFTSAKEAF